MKVDNNFHKHGVEQVDVNRVAAFRKFGAVSNETETIVLRFHASKGYMTELTARMTVEEACKLREELTRVIESEGVKDAAAKKGS